MREDADCKSAIQPIINRRYEAKSEAMPWLAALVCNSAFDIALHDADIRRRDDARLPVRQNLDRTRKELQRDLAYLTRLWRQINKKIQSGPGPTELYTEGDLVTRTVRDVFSAEIDAIIVDTKMPGTWNLTLMPLRMRWKESSKNNLNTLSGFPTFRV